MRDLSLSSYQIRNSHINKNNENDPSAIQVLDKENIGPGLNRRKNSHLSSLPSSPLSKRKQKRSAISGVNISTPPRFQSINTIRHTINTTGDISIDSTTAKQKSNTNCLTSSKPPIGPTSNTMKQTSMKNDFQDFQEEEDFSFAKLKGAVQQFEQKQKAKANHNTTTVSTTDQNCSTSELKGNTSNTSHTTNTSFSSSFTSSSIRNGFGNSNKITSSSSFVTSDSLSTFSASSWSGDFGDDDNKNSAQSEESQMGVMSSSPTAEETNVVEDFSFQKLKQKAIGMENASKGNIRGMSKSSSTTNIISTGCRLSLQSCPQYQSSSQQPEETEEEEDFSFERLKQKASQAPSTPKRKISNRSNITPHTVCARPRPRSNFVPVPKVSGLSSSTSRSYSTPKERSQNIANSNNDHYDSNHTKNNSLIAPHTLCGRSRRSLPPAPSDITPSALFHTRPHSTPRDRPKDSMNTNGYSNSNNTQPTSTTEMKNSTFDRHRFQFKPKIKKEEIQATNNSIASVQKLSQWLSDDPFEKKKQLLIRKGEQISNKSKAFEHEELVNGKLKRNQESRVQRERQYFPTGKVSQNKDWLQNHAFGDHSNKDGENLSELCGVMEKRRLIESAFKKKH